MSKDAQELTVDPYNFIYNLAMNVLGCHHLSLDMAQFIYPKYLSKLEDNPEMDEKHKRFWLIRVVKNKCSNYLRDNKKISFLESIDNDWAMDPSPDPRETIEENEEKQSLHKRLRENIAQLPDDQKKVLHLKYEKELSYEEISKKTGFTLSKIKCVIHRATTNLRKKMVKNE